MQEFKFYIVYPYIENFIKKNHISEKKFCEICDIDFGGCYQRIKHPCYSLIKLADIVKICEVIKVPISKLVVHLD